MKNENVDHPPHYNPRERVGFVSRYQDVKAFHRAMEQPVGDAPPHALSEERVRLRLRLIKEEFFELLGASLDVDRLGPDAHLASELLDAFIERGEVKVDLVELADARADLVYVIEGWCVEDGTDSDLVHAEVHRSNMAKLGPDGKAVFREDGKVSKPPGWTPPDVAGVLARMRPSRSSEDPLG